MSRLLRCVLYLGLGLLIATTSAQAPQAPPPATSPINAQSSPATVNGQSSPTPRPGEELSSFAGFPGFYAVRTQTDPGLISYEVYEGDIMFMYRRGPVLQFSVDLRTTGRVAIHSYSLVFFDAGKLFRLNGGPGLADFVKWAWDYHAPNGRARLYEVGIKGVRDAKALLSISVARRSLARGDQDAVMIATGRTALQTSLMALMEETAPVYMFTRMMRGWHKRLHIIVVRRRLDGSQDMYLRFQDEDEAVQ